VTGLVTACCFLTLLTRLVHLAGGRARLCRPGGGQRWRVVPPGGAPGRVLDRAGHGLADSGSAWRIRLDRRVRPPAAGPAPAPGDRPRGAGGGTEGQGGRSGADRVAPATLLDDAPDDVVVALRERRRSSAEWRSIPIRSVAIPTANSRRTCSGCSRGPGPWSGGRRGASGVEAAYDQVLAGRPGETRIEVDSAGRPVRTVAGRVAVPGREYGFTIDLDVQSMAEQALADGMAAARAGTPGGLGTAAPGGRCGPRPPGRVGLALASAPTFDPPRWPVGSGGHVGGAADPARPLTADRGLQGLYAPGSTFKR